MAESGRKATPDELRRQDYQETFSGKAGQRVLGDLMISYSILSPVYMKGNTNETMFAEGGRNVVLYILEQMKEPLDPKRLLAKIQQAEYDALPIT